MLQIHRSESVKILRVIAPGAFSKLHKFTNPNLIYANGTVRLCFKRYLRSFDFDVVPTIALRRKTRLTPAQRKNLLKYKLEFIFRKGLSGKTMVNSQSVAKINHGIFIEKI